MDEGGAVVRRGGGRPAAEAIQGLEGLPRARAAGAVMQLAAHYGGGVHRDQDWAAVHLVFNAMREHGVDVVVDRSEYAWKDEKMDSKSWWFTVTYPGRGGAPVELKGKLTAQGAGSVANPLSRYDITTVVS